jgi:hypothetical protein
VTIRVLATALVALLLAATAQAQSAAATFVADGIAPLADDGHFRLRLFEAGARFDVPLPVADGNVLIVGGAYDVLLRRYYLADAVRFAGAEEPADRFVDRERLDAPLHDAGIGLLYGRALAGGWLVYGSAAADVAGDFHAVGLADLRPVLTLGAAVRAHPTLALRFGALAVDATRPDLVRPFLGWEWRPAAWFHSEAWLPRRLDLTFTFLDRVEASLFAVGEGREYHVRENGLGFTRLRYVEVRSGVSLGLRVAGALWLAVQGGEAPYRSLSGRDATGDEAWGGPMQGTWFARVALEWRTAEGRLDAGLSVLP